MIGNLFFMAHGAGAGHKSEFLSMFDATFCRTVSKQLSMQFYPMTFSYMEQIELSGKRRPPPSIDKLIAEYATLVNSTVKTKFNIVAGKSMGGRVATQLSKDQRVSGVVCFGFPFHSQGKPEKDRLSFLNNLDKPCLIFQGTRDAFGGPEWIAKHSLPVNVTIKWVEGANHDFDLLKSQNQTKQETIEEMLKFLQQWIIELYQS